MIREQPVINSLNVELAAPSTGLALSFGRLGTDKLSATATTWTTYLGSALDVSIRRGGKRQGVSTSIDVGTMTMTLLNVGDPRTDAAVRPNTSIRVRSKATGAAIFTGRILDVNMAHRRNNVTGKFDRYITLTAVDSVTAHANTKRYGAIAPADHETFEQRISRLALSSRAPVATPAVTPARVLYQLPPGGTAAETEAGWTNLGGATPRAQFRSNSVYATQTFVGTTAKQVVFRQTSYTGTWSDASALTTYLDPAEGALGLVRTVTGLTPGKMYRLRATALLQLDGFAGDSAGLAANVYRLTAVGIGSGSSQRLSLGASVGYQLPAYEFIATSTSATVGIELADRFDASTGRGGYIERVGLGEFVLEEIVTAGSHMLASVAFESSLAEHFDVACASVAGGRWWVDANGVTQFAAGTGVTSFVATFSDVRATGTLEYTGVDTSYDTRNVVNDLTLTNRTTGLNDEGETVGVDTDSGFTDPTSIATWGTRSDTLKVSLYEQDGFAGALSRRALEVLSSTANPVLTLASITWNAAEDPKTSGLLDVYSRINVTFQGTTQPSQVISVSHDITPSRWLITLELVRNN